MKPGYINQLSSKIANHFESTFIILMGSRIKDKSQQHCNNKALLSIIVDWCRPDWGHWCEKEWSTRLLQKLISNRTGCSVMYGIFKFTEAGSCSQNYGKMNAMRELSWVPSRSKNNEGILNPDPLLCDATTPAVNILLLWMWGDPHKSHTFSQEPQA